jgi:hypothetical protein
MANSWLRPVDRMIRGLPASFIMYQYQNDKPDNVVPPGPWLIWQERVYARTPNADPMRLCRNVLVALDAAKGINMGEPGPDAAWIGAIAPRIGETVCHIGA